MRRINGLLLLTIWIVAATTLSSVISLPTKAANHAVTMTATPAVLDTGGVPGAEMTVSFELTNNSDTVLPIHMATREPRVKNGQTSEEVSATSAENWITFAQPDFVLKANEIKVVSATLRIPEDASPGGHYADMIASPLNLESDEAFVVAHPEIAVQLLISVAGDVNESLVTTIDGPSTILAERSSKSEASFNVQNKGNIHTLFQPSLYLYQGESTLDTIHSQPVVILPGEKKQLTFNLPDNMRPGIYRVQAKYSYGSPAKEIASPEVRIVVLPFKLAWLLSIPVIVIVFFILRFRHRLLLALHAITRGDVKERKK